MATKELKARIALKHDTEAHWNLAVNFIPLDGEIIIYDTDATHTAKRFKIGDGVTTVGDLPFYEYSDLLNKPSINGVTLTGNKTTDDLGITSSPMTEITYAALKTLRDAGELIPGMQYRITDYETIITGSYDLSAIGAQGYLHNARSAGHQFDVIVVADDESHLNENARAALHEGDTYFANTAIGAWKLKYCLDNDTTKYTWANTNGKGVIFWMEDEFNNCVGYDFKNIQFLRYAMSLNSANPNAEDTGLVYNASTQPNRYAGMYQIFTTLQAYMEAGTYVNPWGANGNYDFDVSYNILGVIQMPQPDATYLSTFNADWYYTFDYFNGTHKDASLNEFAKVPCRENYIELETEPLFALTQGIHNVYGLGGNVWETNYVFVEELSELAWDNISENKLSMHCWMNTFGNNCYSNTFDANCYSNTFGNFCYLNTFGELCYSNIFGSSCYLNTFGELCYSNTFENSCYRNIFGSSCYLNTFDDGCYSNTFGNSCHSNTFDPNCQSNTFGTVCYLNTFGGSCFSNRFGNNCNNNTFDYSCTDNTFGNYCYSNTFGHNCYRNTLGNNCYSNRFGNNCESNTFDNNCYGNTFGDGCNGNKFGYLCSNNTFDYNCSDNTFGNRCYRNTFGNRCNNNTFGGSCYLNTFGELCYSNTFGYSCFGNRFGELCHSNTFDNNCASNTFGGSCYRNKFGYLCSNNTFVSDITQVHSQKNVGGITLTTTEVGSPQSYTMRDLENYDGTSGHATLYTKSGPNNITAISTTDGGTTWTTVNLTATGVSF